MKNNKLVYDGYGDRLDVYIKTKYTEFSREFIKNLIAMGNVTVNSLKAKPSLKLKYGDEIIISFSDSESRSYFSLKKITIYEDDDILVINKPSGLLVHPTDDNWIRDFKALEFSKNTLVWLLHEEKKLSDVDGLMRLGLVHRLDMETSGVMVIAKNAISQKKLIEEFNTRTVTKNYRAVADGVISDEFMRIDAPIGRFSGSKRYSVMEYGRDAITEIRIIKTGSKNTYLEVFPKTGRTNQIRAHLAFIGHPVIGDRIYSKSNFERLMLHSYKILLSHPSSGKAVEFLADIDSEFKKMLTVLLK
ncbi:MAG: RluA family pseudouridine synthase [Elusimicrobiales bacterium]|jgi:23S rRNA pseudouridine1911/1915/1917 synthase|nr:RluA family pseudouridine synthase [Elusimicrobiales bacterium]